MSLRFLDSFDHYATGDLLEKWTENNGAQIAAGQGRRGTACVQMSNGTLRKALEDQPTWIVGVATHFAGLPSGASAVAVLAVRDALTTQMDLRVNLDGMLSVTRNGTVLATSGAFRLSASVYYYLELLVTIHPSAGVVRVAVDGTTRIALTNVNTQATANSAANELLLAGVTALSYTSFDDLYLCDGTGAVNKAFLGDCRVDLLLPNADGFYNAWIPSTAGPHYALVDETPSTDDTDYLSSTTNGARESHHFTAMPVLPNPQIYGIQHGAVMRKDNAGLQQIRGLIKSGATTQASATLVTLANTYAWYGSIWETNPETGTAWTPAAVDGLEAGVEDA